MNRVIIIKLNLTIELLKNNSYRYKISLEDDSKIINQFYNFEESIVALITRTKDSMINTVMSNRAMSKINIINTKRLQ